MADMSSSDMSDALAHRLHGSSGKPEQKSSNIIFFGISPGSSSNLDQDIKVLMSHLAGLGQAHAYPEAGRHARRQGGRESTAHSRVYHTQASHHCLHYELTGELLHTLHSFIYIAAEQKTEVQGLTANIKAFRKTETLNVK